MGCLPEGHCLPTWGAGLAGHLLSAGSLGAGRGGAPGVVSWLPLPSITGLLMR